MRSTILQSLAGEYEYWSHGPEFADKFEEWVNREAQAFALKDVILLRHLKQEVDEWFTSRYPHILELDGLEAGHGPGQADLADQWLFRLLPQRWYPAVATWREPRVPYSWARSHRDSFRRRIENDITSFDDDQLYEGQLGWVRRHVEKIPEYHRFYGGA